MKRDSQPLSACNQHWYFKQTQINETLALLIDTSQFGLASENRFLSQAKTQDNSQESLEVGFNILDNSHSSPLPQMDPLRSLSPISHHLPLSQYNFCWVILMSLHLSTWIMDIIKYSASVLTGSCLMLLQSVYVRLRMERFSLLHEGGSQQDLTRSWPWRKSYLQKAVCFCLEDRWARCAFTWIAIFVK